MNATARYTATYTPQDRRATVIAPGPKQVDYRYDAAGQRVGMTDPDGGRFTYAYHDASWIETLRNPQDERTTFAYDDAGRRTLKQLANGTRASLSYDAADQLARIYDFTSAGTIISGFDYAYDNAGNRTRVVEANGDRVTWTYDPANQLLSEQRSGANDYAQAYAYDPAGNRTLKNIDGALTTYAYDDANQLRYAQTVSGRTTYTFDNDGNQQIILEPNGDRTTNTWDFENKNTQILLPASAIITAAYDPDGLRVEKNADGDIVKFVWDDQNYLLETNAVGTTTLIYTNEPQLYGNLISHRSGGSPKFYHFDGLGSTRAITNTSQATTDAFLYDAWGNVIHRTGTTYTPFQWVGQLGYYVDPETELIYVRARLYIPRLSRFLSRDPIEHAFVALYQYLAGNPVNWTDPSGHDCPGCDIPAWALGNQANSSPCVLACCAQHDHCYFQHDCTAASWAWNACGAAAGGYFGGWHGMLAGAGAAEWFSPCARCNNVVVACILQCAGGNHMRGRSLYFCAGGPPQVRGKFIRIGVPSPPNDFPNVPAARRACCT